MLLLRMESTSYGGEDWQTECWNGKYLCASREHRVQLRV
jgi:hypothetical protein